MSGRTRDLFAGVVLEVDPRVAGVDEVGRGPRAGPVVVAAVILPVDHGLVGLRDSKRLGATARARLERQILAVAIDHAIALASVEEIDSLNILQATMLAMQRAVASLRVRPAQVLVDGNRAPRLPMPARAIIGGDDLVPAISAASILAKEHRDRLMVALAGAHPGYGFERHKGYGAAVHMEALARLGPSPAHRRSFAPVRAALFAHAGRAQCLPAVPASEHDAPAAPLQSRLSDSMDPDPMPTGR